MLRKLLLILMAIASLLIANTAIAADGYFVSYNGIEYTVSKQDASHLLTDGANIFVLTKTHQLQRLSRPEIDRFLTSHKGTINIVRMRTQQENMVAQGNRDFHNGTPLYDSNGNKVGQRVTSSVTGETTNRDNGGRMLPPWNQW